jgi:hypothetical protein
MDLIPLALNILKGAFEPHTTAFLIILALSARIWRLSGHVVELVITQSQRHTLVAQSVQLSRQSWTDLFDRFYLHTLSKLCYFLGSSTARPSFRDAFWLFVDRPTIYWVYLGTVLTLPFSYYFVHWFFIDWYFKNANVNASHDLLARLLVLLATAHQAWFLISASRNLRAFALFKHTIIFSLYYAVVSLLSSYVRTTLPFTLLFYFSYAPIVPALLLTAWIGMDARYRLALFAILMGGTAVLMLVDSYILTDADLDQDFVETHVWQYFRSHCAGTDVLVAFEFVCTSA